MLTAAGLHPRGRWQSARIPRLPEEDSTLWMAAQILDSPHDELACASCEAAGGRGSAHPTKRLSWPCRGRPGHPGGLRRAAPIRWPKHGELLGCLGLLLLLFLLCPLRLVPQREGVAAQVDAEFIARSGVHDFLHLAAAEGRRHYEDVAVASHDSWNRGAFDGACVQTMKVSASKGLASMGSSFGPLSPCLCGASIGVGVAGWRIVGVKRPGGGLVGLGRGGERPRLAARVGFEDDSEV